jgi:pilus assembly protein CpaE
MYPLNAVVIGCKADALAQVRQHLDTQGVRVEAEFEDVPAAIARLTSTPEETRLLVAFLRHEGDLPALRQLTGAFLGWPVLVVAAPAADSALLLRTIRAGASQVVTFPLNPEDFREALNCIGVQFGHSPDAPGVIAISGASGGCGTTSLAVNLAYEVASRFHTSCILAEFSLKMGSLEAYLDVAPRFTSLDLLLRPHIDLYVVKEVLTHVTDNFDLLPGPRGLTGPVNISPALLLQLINYLRRLARVVIIDVPATYDDIYFETLAAADQAILVGEQKVPSARALKMVNDALDRDTALRTQHLVKHLVINRYDSSMHGFTLKDLSQVLEIPQLRSVANDAAGMTAAVNKGKPLREVAPNSPALADIHRLARSILLMDEGDDPSRTHVGRDNKRTFTRLLKAFGL